MKVIRPILFAALLSTTSLAYAEISFSDLVEVTDKTKGKCVEYYTRQGVLYCSTKALDTSPLPPDIITYEKQNIVFDERPWKLAWGKKTDTVTTVEYVPMGEDINDWNELITSQYLNPTQIPYNTTPRMLAERIIKGIQDTKLDPWVTYHEVTPDMAIFEFRITQPKNQIQDEIQIIRKTDNGFYILHYVVKEADMGKEKRDKWISNLSKSKVKN